MTKNKGILDPEGTQPNPLTGNPYSPNYTKLSAKWKNFPVYSQVQNIIQDIKQNQVYLVIAATGSGKSVLIPKIALHTYDYDAKIVMTLPKQIIAKSSAEFAAATLDVELGKEVGYQYRGSPTDSRSSSTKLLYATDGTIRARLLKDPALRDFDCVLIDEAHERSVQIDFLIYLLRITLRLRPEFKLIIMSATINADIFHDYFKEFKFKKIDVGGARTYPIESIFHPQEISYNIAKTEAFKILIKILTEDQMEDPSKAHDIILFVTSSNEAYDFCRMLSSRIQQEKNSQCKITCKGDVFCVELFSGIDKEKEKLAVDKDEYKKGTNFNRKVVISTNVAESSLTVDGIKYVIDTGFQLKDSYDIKLRAKKLDTELISKSQATQRMGRAGRTEPGVCYHLYTKDQFMNKMKKFPEPNIRTNDITGECLNLICQEGIETVDKLTKILTNFIEPPHQDFVELAISNLESAGAIKDGRVSQLGIVLSSLPFNDIFSSLAYLYAKYLNCAHEMLRILVLTDVAKRNVNEIFNQSSLKLKNSEDDAEKQRVLELEVKFRDVRNGFLHKSGDHLSMLNIYETFKKKYDAESQSESKIKTKSKSNSGSVDFWIKENFLKKSVLLKAMNHIKITKQRVHKTLNDFGKEWKDSLNANIHPDVKNYDLDDKLLYCLTMGLKENRATKTSDSTSYRTYYTRNVKINKISFLHLNKNLPKNICYSELFVLSGKSDLNVASHIPKKIVDLVKN